jgi:hypothetical protein
LREETLPGGRTAVHSFALTETATAVPEAPNAQDNPVPLFHDVSRVALRNVRVIDGTGAPARANQMLMIESGRILAVGNVNEVRIPGATKIVDLEGLTDRRASLPEVWRHHDPNSWHEQTYAVLNLKRRIGAGQAPGPGTPSHGSILERGRWTWSGQCRARGGPDQTIDAIDDTEITFMNGIAYEPKMLLAGVKGQVGRP